MKLLGKRVVLRLARPEDADALAQGFVDDPTLGAMLGMEPEQENAAWLRGTFPEDGQRGEQRTAYWFAIAHAESGELIGEIGLVGISWPDRRAGVSILVLPGSRGAGVGREAIELLVGGRTADSVYTGYSCTRSLRTLRCSVSPKRRASCARACCAITASNGGALSTTSSTPDCRHDR